MINGNLLLDITKPSSYKPSLIVLQSPQKEIFDFLVDEAAHFFVHFVTYYGSTSSLLFANDNMQSLL